MGDPFEAEAFMEGYRCRVRQGDPGICAMYVFALDSFEQLLLEPRARAPPNRFQHKIDAGFDRGGVPRFRPVVA
jgi:hypothetical protein